MKLKDLEENVKKKKNKGKRKKKRKRTLSLKERGGRMTVPFFWSILPILLPAAAAKVKQIGSHISSSKIETQKTKERKNWEEEIKKSKGELGFTLEEHCLENFCANDRICPFDFFFLSLYF